MRIETGAPLCSPTPLHSTEERIVCSGIKSDLIFSLETQ